MKDVLCQGGVSAASQEEKEGRQRGTPRTGSAPLALKGTQGVVGSAQESFPCPLERARQAGTLLPVLGQGDAPGGKMRQYRESWSPQESIHWRFLGLVFWCQLNAIVRY